MARKLTMGINWQGKLDYKQVIERVKIADDAGIHSMWVAEAWGRDAFTLLTLLAEHTKKIQLGTSIVNIYSRTPAALAQHFATLDELSGGRMIIGLGTSGPQVIEHFHGVKFNPPLTRLKEYVDIINLIMAGEPLNYNGKLFKLSRGFTIRMEPPRKHIPIFIASLNQKSVEFTAQKADGWLPVMIPVSGLGKAISEFRAIAKAAGRDPKAVEVKAPGAVMVTKNPDRAKAGQAATVAFYAARMGTFYSEQLTRFGFGDEVRKIKEAWDSGGSKAGTEAVPEKMLSQLGYSGDVNGARARLIEQEQAGAELHTVDIDAKDPAEFEKIVHTLMS
ncbi:MAG TPA: LLM class flavin-dependent oxidoreductase [Candidatus Binataceae bacterium]|nr:LLM class flavin-dependent oxidoreductase [Candidatus Binataceae bacterium]